MTKPIHHILIQPLLTEKSVASIKLQRYTRKDAQQVAAGNKGKADDLREQSVVKYTFKVALDATKPEIAGAVETMFAKDKVKVQSVHTIHVRGKERRSLGRRQRSGAQKGSAPDWKKAIVTLTPDSPNIPLLEGV